jgi:phosphatidylserine/phosphatidylglycerophosphate/cardiolipin synthase-like enzyme
MAFLEPERTCWRLARAGRVAFLVDTQAYFSTIRLALQRARRSVLLLGWSFDPRTRLLPDGIDAETGGIGRLLIELSDARPELDIRVLAWKSALPIAISQEFFPHRAREWFLGTRVHFRLDDAVPMGGCHHQKVLVIDDRLAFCGGGDISIDRWDTTAHLDADSRRLDPDHHFHSPRHEVVMMVDGEAAAALGELARERWRRATDEALEPPAATEHQDDPWPAPTRADLYDAQVAIVRTEPAWRGRSGVYEWRELTLRAIAGARRVIYMENQYFTSPVVAAALARRLAEPDGPEIVLISTRHSPSYFDKATMDRARAVMLRWLHEADVYGRFRAFHPSTPHGSPVLVHAKVMVVDDQLARIGSANLNNRSGGVDTECELAIEASGPAEAAAIVSLRNFLAGHYLGRSAADVAAAIERRGSLIGALEALNHGGRLQPIAPLKLGRLGRIIANWHLGDALEVDDMWRPWRRRRKLDEAVRAVTAGEPMA